MKPAGIDPEAPDGGQSSRPANLFRLAGERFQESTDPLAASTDTLASYGPRRDRHWEPDCEPGRRDRLPREEATVTDSLLVMPSGGWTVEDLDALPESHYRHELTD